MVPHLRDDFNRRFTAARYQHFLATLTQAAGSTVDFRVCETPVFLPPAMRLGFQQAARELVQLISQPAYLAASQAAVPPAFHVPHDDDHPLFLAIDFAVTRDERGQLQPRLIELQGFPSLYAYQLVLCQSYVRAYGLGELRYLPDDLSETEYLRLLRQALLAGHDPENVILMEIEPEKQKTAVDFVCTERFTGVKAVCITRVQKRGRRLFYRANGREIAIHRIYNRVIVDEFVKKGLPIAFDFRDDLEVEWAGHPNWYFRISKFSLPYLDHPVVPRTYFLHTLEHYPEPLSDYVLKPLFSFAGSGVVIDVSREQLDAIPAAERHNYILQEKISYAPVIQTPDEPARVEIRMMFLWQDRPRLVNWLARLSKGKMMGVDYNKNKEWIGSSGCLYE
ncbi:MAG: hypothetical protein ONB48_02590 [candidate division KSB1 bacterium]|nr:hypothetical protein [candidate division KSB1 bacterium]MDZ7275768.1 hypothetical protein [candidate division KSB1 bacterium]MDZ7284541.1 hypothetical protein [candidate division KSB1 bacterium]MDZ7298040.1 hypothetical protein [candidate division KSB1 bacterium]MDZ7309087.1 hypothetical protein [candidate division KSB1 bacterium]